MSALQWIVKEAKSLKKSYPKRFTKWTDYVKQASAIYASKHGGKSPVGKKKTVVKGSSSPLKKKVLGALPIGFTGNIWGVKFKIVNQYNIYGDVTAIAEDIETGNRILTFDGVKHTGNLSENFYTYISNHRTNDAKVSDMEIKRLKATLLKFCKNMQMEVKAFNSGKTKTIKKQPLVIPLPKSIVKKAAPKKVAIKKAAPKKSATKKHLKYAGTMHSQDGKKMYKYSLGKTPSGTHKDIKIHNVNIKIVSGINEINEHSLTDLKHSLEKLKKYQKELFNSERNLKSAKLYKYSKTDINYFVILVESYKKMIKELKIHITQLKKNIK